MPRGKDAPNLILGLAMSMGLTHGSGPVSNWQPKPKPQDPDEAARQIKLAEERRERKRKKRLKEKW